MLEGRIFSSMIGNRVAAFTSGVTKAITRPFPPCSTIRKLASFHRCRVHASPKVLADVPQRIFVSVQSKGSREFDFQRDFEARFGAGGFAARFKRSWNSRRAIGCIFPATSLDGFKSRLATGSSLLPWPDERMPRHISISLADTSATQTAHTSPIHNSPLALFLAP